VQLREVKFSEFLNTSKYVFQVFSIYSVFTGIFFFEMGSPHPNSAKPGSSIINENKREVHN
jgi:hypothetical protein